MVRLGNANPDATLSNFIDAVAARQLVQLRKRGGKLCEEDIPNTVAFTIDAITKVIDGPDSKEIKKGTNMANLTKQFETSFMVGADEAMVDPRELIKRLERRREVDNKQILRALEIVGEQLALLKSAQVALAKPVLEPAAVSPKTEALAAKLKAESIAKSRR